MRARLGRRDDTGAATTTVAIVTPAVLVLLMLAVQAGLFWHARQRADLPQERLAVAGAECDRWLALAEKVEVAIGEVSGGELNHFTRRNSACASVENLAVAVADHPGNLMR